VPLAINYIIARAVETYTPSSAVPPHSPFVRPRHPLLLPNIHQYRSAVLLHAPRKRLKRFPLLSWKSAIAIPLPTPEGPLLLPTLISIARCRVPCRIASFCPQGSQASRCTTTCKPFILLNLLLLYGLCAHVVKARPPACKTCRIVQCLEHAETGGERIAAQTGLAKHRSRPSFHVGHCQHRRPGPASQPNDSDASDATSPTTGYTHVLYPVTSMSCQPASTKGPA
jgi:hypothetical protein